LVIAGKAREGGIAHALIKEPRSFVPYAHFQSDPKHARYEGAFFEPLFDVTDKLSAVMSKSPSL
jgi:hypothetical protein